MKHKTFTAVYAFTLLISAALLFSIQPLFSKMVLPLLGGTPQVWNTAMVFFQLCLLGGYAYAHGTSRFLSIKAQGFLHLILLIVFTVVLPLSIPDGWVPPADQNPTLWQLSVMAMTVGGPFFVLSGSAPMLQRWFSQSDHPDADNPYFLYGASNLGSMTSLLAYPVIIEPIWTLSAQSEIWSYGYYGLIALTALSILVVWKATLPQTKTLSSSSSVTWPQRLRWLLLAFIPSSLMLGVTTYITTDIASVPLLWILPLALYVGTFIIVFARKPLITAKHAAIGFAVLLIAFFIQRIAFGNIPPHPFINITLHFTLFFFAALMAHAELVRARPAASHLTEFYLLMSLGGALGGIFNAIIAPHYLIIPFEYAAVLILACFVRFMGEDGQSFKEFLSPLLRRFGEKGMDVLFERNSLLGAIILIAGVFAANIPSLHVFYASAGIVSFLMLFFLLRRWSFAFIAAALLLMFPPGHNRGYSGMHEVLHQDRNFFGVIRVKDTADHERVLMHGTTSHGAQALSDEYKMMPLSYYSIHSPINAFEILDARAGQQRVASIGLGVGVIACFQRDDRHFDFYEIDKDIADIAEDPTLFTYLPDCGSPYDIILGDGRLKIREQKDDIYDMLLLDAFSSDNIPVHLLTREAIEIYKRVLKPGGILIFNISNNHLDLEPVLKETADELGFTAYAHVTEGGTIDGTDLRYYPAHFLIMTDSSSLLAQLEDKGWSEAMPRDGVRGWTDQYSNILSVIGNVVATKRAKAVHEANKAENTE